jgi:hypothetical protein
MTEKSELVWQAAQLALVAVGIWLSGMPAVLAKLSKLEWQLAQAPVVGCTASATLKMPAVT